MRHVPHFYPLARRRIAERLTQPAVAARVGCAPETVGCWERGVRPPSRTHRTALEALSGGTVPATGWARVTRSGRDRERTAVRAEPGA